MAPWFVPAEPLAKVAPKVVVGEFPVMGPVEIPRKESLNAKAIRSERVLGNLLTEWGILRSEHILGEPVDRVGYPQVRARVRGTC